MGSFKTCTRAYDPLDLAMLEWVLDCAWSTFKARAPLCDSENDEKLKTKLRQKLFALACVGMDDPDALTSRLVASMVLSGPGVWAEPQD